MTLVWATTGRGNFVTKVLPLLGVADYNGVYIIRLTAPLK